MPQIVGIFRLSSVDKTERERAVAQVNVFKEIVREEILKAAKELGENERIPDPYENFASVMTEHDRIASPTEIILVLDHRPPEVQKRYRWAIQTALLRSGLPPISTNDAIIRILNALPQGWTGTMGI